MRQLAEIVSETVPDCRVEFAPGASPDTRNYRVSCDKAADLLGFRTTWTAREGAKELYRAYQQVGLDLAEFEGSATSGWRTSRAGSRTACSTPTCASSRAPKNPLRLRR
jgi:hypothetical protein